MNKLFHYCSIDTFLAIISSKSLRLSDLSKTNDYMERKWILNLIESALIEFFENIKLDINLREEYYYSEGIYNHLDYFLEEIKSYVVQPSFITCFSKKGDLLSQWRAYANDGTGVAIGFNMNLIDNVSNRNSSVSIEDVLYDSKNQIDMIKIAAMQAFNHFCDFFDYRDKEYDSKFIDLFKEESEVFGEVFANDIAKISCYVKNPAFVEEDEVRIFYSPYLNKESEDKEILETMNQKIKFNNYILNPINYSVRNNQIVGYADLSFEKLVEKGIISEIIIGPSSKVSKDDIVFCLAKYGFDTSSINIINSKATYKIK